MLDPVFTALKLSYDPPPPPPNLAADEEAARAREHAKILQLKQRRLVGGGLTIRRADPDGVYMRQDVEDESGEVDVGAGARPPPRLQGATSMASDDGDVSMAPPPGGTRLRRPSKKAQKTPGARASVVKAARTKKALSFKPEPEPPPPVPVVDGLVKLELAPDGGVLPDASAVGNTKKVKPKSGTFKVAWSVEEQRLLERLLEEHPDGSKNRYVLAFRVSALPGLTGVADGSRSLGRWVAGVRRARSRAACRNTLKNFGALG
jgi:hypothetical protein